MDSFLDRTKKKLIKSGSECFFYLELMASCWFSSYLVLCKQQHDVGSFSHPLPTNRAAPLPETSRRIFHRHLGLHKAPSDCAMVLERAPKDG